MAKSSKIIIPTDKVTENLTDHLALEGNKRIVFSAPFGAGKSYFLERFFNDEQRKMLNITLHPIDYSVASNEDIFELIKHDILKALMEKYLDDLRLEKEDFTRLLIIQEFIRNKMDLIGLAKSVLSKLSSEAEAVNEVVEKVKSTKGAFKKFEKTVKIDEQQVIIEYISELQLKTGSVRENDAMTAMIKDFVQRIKSANANQPFVLILDDLDRLDPDHVFRLFNLFTAHHDSKTEVNKFDFDQLIFVCDINNIYHMFIHKYGANVDFSGYIDKFYSSHIFNFDFKRYLTSKIQDLILAKFNFDKEFGNKGAGLNLHDSYNIKDKSPNFKTCLFYVIEFLVAHDRIRIRNFERFQSFVLPNYEIVTGNGRKQNSYEFAFLVMASVFQQFFPRFAELEAALQYAGEKFAGDYTTDAENLYYDDSGIHSMIIEYCLPFVLPAKDVFHREIASTQHSYDMKSESGQDIRLEYVSARMSRLRLKKILIPKISAVGLPTPDTEIETISYEPAVRPNPFWFLLLAVRNCIENNYLRNP
ncbi:P-loop NTPase fold protein [Pedobacter panaciterrae]|uniref:P-loop NTPase fold protein n=1 Tax=Pedobacter panaciterrae TaxID=363849 RepID=A0ABU8NHH9_9SPHI